MEVEGLIKQDLTGPSHIPRVIEGGLVSTLLHLSVFFTTLRNGLKPLPWGVKGQMALKNPEVF